MCKGSPILRVLGFVFLTIAFLACSVGFISPFWIQNTKSTSGSTATQPAAAGGEEQLIPSSSAVVPALSTGSQSNGGGGGGVSVSVQSVAESTTSLSLIMSAAASLDGSYEASHPDWYFEGLWAKCHYNYSCQCFVQYDFAMEKQFPDWHKAAQGLYALGFLVLFITLLIAGFYLCCRCCRESVKLATVLGSLTLSGLVLIGLSLAVYGGFAYKDRGVTFEESEIVFYWAYFVAIGGAGVAIFAAIFYLIDGCRSTIVVEHDDCETAKMV